MRLRTYLIRRAIHTVITLLVVLVLLFVIFRLMPGDPSRFFIAPGQPPQVRDEICVSFGLCKWISAAGNGYEGQITAGANAAYNITAFVNDTVGNQGRYLFVYNKLPQRDEQFRNHRWVQILDVSLSTGGSPPRPSLPDGGPGTVTVRAQFLFLPATPPGTVSLRVLRPDNVTWDRPASVAEANSYVHWDVAATDLGTYWGILHGQNATGAGVDVTFGFAINAPAPGFDLVEDKFYGRTPVFPPDRAIISVNVTSRAGPIANVTAARVASQWGLPPQTDIRLRHPLRAVPRNL